MRQSETRRIAISSHVRSSSAGFKGNKVNVVEVDEEQDVLKAKVGGDGKLACEVSSRPLTAMDGAGTGGESGKGRLDVHKTGGSNSVGERELRRHERQGDSDRQTIKVVRDTKCRDSGGGDTQRRKGVSRHRKLGANRRRGLVLIV